MELKSYGTALPLHPDRPAACRRSGYRQNRQFRANLVVRAIPGIAEITTAVGVIAAVESEAATKASATKATTTETAAAKTTTAKTTTAAEAAATSATTAAASSCRRCA